MNQNAAREKALIEAAVQLTSVAERAAISGHPGDPARAHGGEA